jgi:hypothetical protein
MNRHSSVGIANGLDGRGSNPGRDKIFIFTTSRLTLGAPKPGSISTGVTQEGHEADHSPPSSVEVKNGGAISLLPHMSSLVIAKLITHRDSFTILSFPFTVTKTGSETLSYRRDKFADKN